MAADVVVPIVFTEYLIAVPHTTIGLPKFMNDLGIQDIRTPTKLPNLGHAGALLIHGTTGLTKYYEYGRYDEASKGLVRTRSIPDVKLSRSGTIDLSSLKVTLKAVSSKAGQNGRISGAFIEVPGKFAAMVAYADKRMADNSSAKRAGYSLTGNSCLHFMKGVMEAAGLSTPLLADPRPVSYVDEIRDDHPDLDYDPCKNVLKIEGITR